MGVVSITGKAFLIFVGFLLSAILWALYITPAMNYSFYLLVNETAPEVISSFPSSAQPLLNNINFFVTFINLFPRILIILGAILSGIYLVRKWTLLKYQYPEQ